VTRGDASTRPILVVGSRAQLPAAGSELKRLASVAPSELHATLAAAGALVLLEPSEFPIEGLLGIDLDIPIILSLHAPASGGRLEASPAVESLLRELTPFDRVAVASEERWRALRDRFLLTEGQRIPSAEPSEIVKETSDLLSCLGPSDIRDEKSAYRTRRDALDRVFAAAAKLISRDGELTALEVCSGVTQCAGLARRYGMSFTSLDPNPDYAQGVRQSQSESRSVETSGAADLSMQVACADLVSCVNTLQHCRDRDRGGLVQEMWRVLAPGGWLVALEEMVPRHGSGSYLGAADFETAMVEGTGGGAVLEHFEALRYPLDDLHCAGLALCSKVSGTSDAVRVHGLSLTSTSESQQELGYGSRG